jgi:hypothetical protein
LSALTVCHCQVAGRIDITVIGSLTRLGIVGTQRHHFTDHRQRGRGRIHVASHQHLTVHCHWAMRREITINHKENVAGSCAVQQHHIVGQGGGRVHIAIEL